VLLAETHIGKNIMCLVNFISLSLRCERVFTQVTFLQMNLCEIFAVVSVSRAVNIGYLEKDKPYFIVGLKEC